MFEIEVKNVKTNERMFIFGTTVKRAMEKKNLDPKEWEVVIMDYVD